MVNISHKSICKIVRIFYMIFISKIYSSVCCFFIASFLDGVFLQR